MDARLTCAPDQLLTSVAELLGIAAYAPEGRD
jgi:hypothetical protein